jgi:hypothetical protein
LRSGRNPTCDFRFAQEKSQFAHFRLSIPSQHPRNCRYNPGKRRRPLTLAILVACAKTFVLALTLGADPGEIWTPGILAWIAPRWIHDKTVWRLTEALTVVLPRRG